MAVNSYNLNAAAEALGIKSDILISLIKEMTVNTEGYISQMKALIPENRFEELRRTAHTLKGMAANLRFETLSKHAKIIEEKAKSEEPGGYNVTLTEIESELAAIKTMIGKM